MASITFTNGLARRSVRAKKMLLVSGTIFVLICQKYIKYPVANLVRIELLVKELI